MSKKSDEKRQKSQPVVIRKRKISVSHSGKLDTSADVLQAPEELADSALTTPEKRHSRQHAVTSESNGFTPHGMDQLIGLISKLQDVFAPLDAASNEIKLPQIVVVGAQSAGKSSLLERIVGRDFLPRGTGIVTRQPLVLDLVYVPAGDPRRSRHPDIPQFNDYAEFEKYKDLIFTDFNKVRDAIEHITDEECGTNKGICPTPIKLRIFSDNVVDLSVVDLPGLTNLAVGAQPEDIPQQIRDMVSSYIKNENTIILAVTPANTDIATSEPMKLAKDYDPNGDRTLAVLTKLDLMDRGTTAEDVLIGKAIAVKLGIIGVVNRSQADFGKKTLEDIQRDEEQFLKKNYPTIAHQNGCVYLANALNTQLTEHIKRCLPGLKDRVREKIVEHQDTLTKLGEKFDDPNLAVVKVVSAFTTQYNSLIREGDARMAKGKFSPAAKISAIFHEDFVDEVNEINPLKGVNKADIEHLLRNATGLNPHVFIPHSAFTQFLKSQILRFLQPSIRMVDCVKDVLLESVDLCDDNQKPTDGGGDAITVLIKKDPESESDSEADEPQYDEEGNVIGMPSSDQNSRNVRLIRRLVPAYFQSVRENVKDMAPKFIVHNMIDYLRVHLLEALMSKLHRCEDVAMLFREQTGIANKRTLSVNMLDALMRAEKLIKEIGQAY